MDNRLLAILIHEHPEPFKTLKGALDDLSVESYCAKGCSEAHGLIAQYKPLVVFVDLPIWNKGHAEILNIAKAADQPLNLIVLGPMPDIEQYVSVLQQGAFNFIAPPLSHESLTMVVHAAAIEARQRRETFARVAVAHPSPEAAAQATNQRCVG